MNKIKIGIDLDSTINVSAATIGLFSFLTNCLKDKAEIHIITNRATSEKSRNETVAELKRYGVHYDELAITANKYDHIIKNDITVYVDDTDEYFLTLPESVIVFKIREPGNFDFEKHKWIYGDKTGYNFKTGK